MAEREKLIVGGCDCGCCGPVPESTEEERELLVRQKQVVEQRLAELEERSEAGQ